ncbi:MAG: DoxX family protein, partial [Gammaproteobacteria bacterium]
MQTIITSMFKKLETLTQLVPEWFVALFVRISIASVFWRSAQTKISGGELFGQNWKFWDLSENTFMLFQYEYSLPILPIK